MLISRNFEENLAETVFVQAWKGHKILKLLLFDTLNGLYYIYNPFIKELSTFDMSSLIDFSAFNKDRLRNIHRYPLYVNIFKNFVYCKVTEDLKFGLICGELIESIGKSLNATVKYVEPETGRDFGAIVNGKTSGGIREIEEQRVDISTTMRGLAFFNNATQMLYLTSITEMKMSFIVPNEYYRPEIKIFPHEFFDKLTCALIGASFVTILLFTYILIYFNSKASPKIGFKTLFFTYFAIAVNSTVHNLPKNNIFRKMAATVFLVFLILNSSYQGLIITALNVNKGRNLQTMNEILINNLTIFIPINLERLIHEYSVLPKETVARRLYDKAIISEINTLPKVQFVAEKRDAAILVPTFYFPAFKNAHLNPYSGTSYLHELPECAYQYHMSAVTQRNSPYIERFNDIILRLVAAGLINHQKDVGKGELDLAYIRLVKAKLLQEKKIRLISMDELWFLFMCYGIMLCFAAAVLFIEVIANFLLKF